MLHMLDNSTECAPSPPAAPPPQLTITSLTDHLYAPITSLTLLGQPGCNVGEVRKAVPAVHSSGASAFSCFTCGKVTTQLWAEHWASCIREDGSRLGLRSMAQGWVELGRVGGDPYL